MVWVEVCIQIVCIAITMEQYTALLLMCTIFDHYKHSICMHVCMCVPSVYSKLSSAQLTFAAIVQSTVELFHAATLSILDCRPV